MTATEISGLGAARVEITVTCGDSAHRLVYEQAVVDISAQPGKPDRMQMELTGKRIITS